MDEEARHLSLGRSGERAALRWYAQRGYQLVAANWRCRIGEIDLVLRRPGTIVFCEVKTRRGAALGGAYEAVTPTKQRKLRALAEAFLASTGERPDSVRFDVASVQQGPASTHVHVFEDAF